VTQTVIRAYRPVVPRRPPVRPGENLTVTFRRTTSDDNLHPDYLLTVGSTGTADLGPMNWAGTHHGRGFRRSPLYRHLFPRRDGPPPDP
jgi:type I protein arginine methyltransferase